MDRELRILMVEDQPLDAELLQRELKRGGIQFSARIVDNKESFQRALSEFCPDFILSDFSMPNFDGISALKLAHEHTPDTPFIFVSGTIGEERAIEALRYGATDYLLKDRPQRLVSAINRALDDAKNRAALRLQEEKLNYLAYYDALTGLPNHKLFRERLNECLAAVDTEIVLIVANIDRFGFINESLGHHAGDLLLREVANRLRSAWPDPDRMGRLTANSFAGVLTGVGDVGSIRTILERISKQAFAAPFLIEDKEINVSITAGIAVAPADGKDADTLLRNSEAALNRAKASNSRYLFYEQKMNASVIEMLTLENKLRRALEHDRFEMYYQPKINLGTGKIIGLEALIRWNDPEWGIVSPVRFIPLLEETGLIIPVGQWALKRALADRDGWRSNGLVPPGVAVNVSSVQLSQDDFVDIVRGTVTGFEGDTHGLELEITESVLMRDIDANTRKLSDIRGMGFNIAIDDFGTGYSSLSYLARLPVTSLKIDRSFVIAMTDDADNMAIVSTIISLAHSLNHMVIAEGVETDNQRQLLKLLKCDEAQGFLFSKPLSLQGMTDLLKEKA